MKTPWLKHTCIALLLLLGSPALSLGQESNDDTVESATDIEAAEVEVVVEDAEFDFEETMESIAEAVEKFFESFEENVENVVDEAEVQYEQSMNEAANQLQNSEEHIRVMEKSMKVAEEVLREIRTKEFRIPEIRIPEIRIPPMSQMPFAPSLKRIRGDFHGEIVSTSDAYTFLANEQTEIHINASFTDITAIPSEDASTVGVLVEIVGGAQSLDQAQAIHDAIDVEIEQDNSIVEIDISAGWKENEKYDSGRQLRMVSLQIMVPTDTPLKIDSEFGKIHVEQIGGSLESDSEFGPVLVRGSKGTLVINNEHGETKVVSHRGDAHIRTQFGATIINGIEGNLVVNAEYGETNIRGLNDEAVVKLNQSFGEGTIYLPVNYKGSIRAVSEWGEVTTPFELERSEEMFTQSMQGRVAEGEGRVDVTSSFGGIQVLVEEETHATD